MRKTAKRIEEEPIEAAEGSSSPKKSKSREKKVSAKETIVVNSRLPRAAKTKANNNFVDPNPVEKVKKARGRAKPELLIRSNSSEDIAPKPNRRLRRSRSAEVVYHQGVPPPKKSKNGAIEKPPAKKSVPKKTATQAKGKSKGKIVKDVLLEIDEDEAEDEEQEEPEEERRPLIAKKAYSKAPAKKLTAAETKDNDEPKKRVAGKKVEEVVPPKKNSRGRGKTAKAEEDDNTAAAEMKLTKVKKVKANGKKAASSVDEDEAKEVDDEDAENAAEDADGEEAAKQKKGKKINSSAKRPRGKKAAPTADTDEMENQPKDDDAPVENAPEEPEVSKDEL